MDGCISSKGEAPKLNAQLLLLLLPLLLLLLPLLLLLLPQVWTVSCTCRQGSQWS